MLAVIVYRFQQIPLNKRPVKTDFDIITPEDIFVNSFFTIFLIFLLGQSANSKLPANSKLLPIVIYYKLIRGAYKRVFAHIMILTVSDKNILNRRPFI